MAPRTDVPEARRAAASEGATRPLILLAASLATAAAVALYSRVEGPTFLLGWVMLVPWLAALDGVRTLRGAVGAGLLLCVTFTVAVFFWFAQAMQGYTGAPLAVAILVLALLAPLLQPQLIVFAVARALARRAGFWSRAVAGAGVYVGAEWLLPKLFADTIGHGLFASAWMRQAADLAGAPGLTFVLVLGNECVLAVGRGLLATRPRRLAAAPLACLVALVIGLCAYGEVRLRQLSAPDSDAITAAVVQGDLSHYGQLAAQTSTYDTVRLILDTHFALSQQALQRGPLDLLVWPETVYPTTFGTPKSEDGAAFDREIAAFVAQSATPLLFGAYDVEDGREFNAAFLLEPSSGRRTSFDTYRKARLFPFTERVPRLFDAPAMRAWLPWMGTWQEGGATRTLTFQRRDGRPLEIAPLICYDAVDPSLALAAARQGAEVIVAISNDSWFAEGGGPRLHLVVSAFRSLETRRPQIRATTTGVSAMISPTGELQSTVGVHEKGVLVARVAPVRSADTLMLAWGDWFGPVALLLGIGALSLALARRAASTRSDAARA